MRFRSSSGITALILMAVVNTAIAQGEKRAVRASGAETAPPDSAVLARAIDAQIQKSLEAKKVPTSPRTTDAEFLRRTSLDITGVIPTADKAAAFLDSTDPVKRAKLVEELLTTPEHARQMADLWKELLLPKTAAAARRDQTPIVGWLNRSSAENKPDKLVTELLTADGFQDTSPATTFYVVHESVDMLTDRVSRVFMGVQIQCAQCHDHPFADWKRDEYWGLATFFTKVGRLYERTPERVEKYGASENVKKTLMLPDSTRKVPAKYLRGAEVKLDQSKPYLPVLAEWLTSPENPFFAKAMVNRIWFHYFGRGLVNPVDGMNPDVKPSHPELLDLLAKQFISSGFDARFLMRAICLSETYQRSCRPIEGNKDDQHLYSHMAMRVLLPFQLCDSWDMVWSADDVKRPMENIDDPKALKKSEGHRNGFANFFAAEEGSVPTDYKNGIPQALRLMNSKDTSRISRVVSAVLKEAKSPSERITLLYLTTLTRRPTTDELSRRVGFVEKNGNQSDVYGDLLWALINSTEFMTNH